MARTIEGLREEYREELKEGTLSLVQAQDDGDEYWIGYWTAYIEDREDALLRLGRLIDE